MRGSTYIKHFQDICKTSAVEMLVQFSQSLAAIFLSVIWVLRHHHQLDEHGRCLRLCRTNVGPICPNLLQSGFTAFASVPTAKLVQQWRTVTKAVNSDLEKTNVNRGTQCSSLGLSIHICFLQRRRRGILCSMAFLKVFIYL